MFEKFGEFDSVEELNRAAEAQRAEGDEKALVLLAEANGIDKEDAEDFMDGCIPVLATPLMAATGKIRVESESLILKGVLTDWRDTLLDLCTENEELQAAVRRKGKSLCECMAALIRFAFENKEQVNDEIVRKTKIMHNGKEEPMRSPLYLGVPNKTQVKKLILEYYLGRKDG